MVSVYERTVLYGIMPSQLLVKLSMDVHLCNNDDLTQFQCNSIYCGNNEFIASTQYTYAVPNN